jgi:hypothetical protein
MLLSSIGTFGDARAAIRVPLGSGSLVVELLDSFEKGAGVAFDVAVAALGRDR